MSQTDVRRLIPVNRRTKPPHHSPTPSPSKSSSSHRRSSKPPSDSVKVFDRCNSMPTLPDSGDNDRRNLTPPDCWLLRNQNFTEIFSSSPDLFYRSPHKIEGYNKESKVLINVTVEGSPGAIRTMVKLGTSVEEAIKTVLTNYSKEGRTPRLHDDGLSSASFELHSSYFSLHSLSKSELIGDIGGRTFYLRKCKNIDSHENVINSEITKESLQPPFLFLSLFFSPKFKKIMRSTRKLWRILGCLEY